MGKKIWNNYEISVKRSEKDKVPDFKLRYVKSKHKLWWMKVIVKYGIDNDILFSEIVDRRISLYANKKKF